MTSKTTLTYLYENAAPAILAWILEGAQEVIRRKFKIDLPTCVRKAIHDYHEANDWLGHFLAERCEIGTDLEAKSGELYTAYRMFCLANGEYIRSTTDFYSALDAEKFTRHKTRFGIRVHGLQLLDTASDEAERRFPSVIHLIGREQVVKVSNKCLRVEKKIKILPI